MASTVGQSSGMAPESSVYHEPWWLDAATGGQWSEVVIRDGLAIARLVYAIHPWKGFLISRMPSLVHMLGPVISGLKGKPVTVWRRKLELTNALIDGLSGVAYFEQVFDPRVGDAAAFSLRRGFEVTTSLAFRLDAGTSIKEAWAGMTAKTRGNIRSAASHLTVQTMTDVEAFCEFYERCLEGQPNYHDAVCTRTVLSAAQARGVGQLLAARTKDGQLAAAIVLVWDQDAVRYFLAARDRTKADMGGVSLLVWEAMQIAVRRGLAFDFDGANTRDRLLFLSGFGGRLVQCPVVWRSLPEFPRPRTPPEVMMQF